MKAWDFANILWNDLNLEFMIVSTEDGTCVTVINVPLNDMAEWLSDVKEKTGMTPSTIEENGDNYELGYSFIK